MLLIVDDSNGIEWLVRPDGSVTRAVRVDEERLATDPSAVVRLHGRPALRLLVRAGPRDRSCPHLARALDGHLHRPPVGPEPWGRRGGVGSLTVARPRPRGLVGARRRTAAGGLAQATQRGSVRNGPADEPLFWSRPDGSDTLALHSLGEDGEWQLAEVFAPFASHTLTLYLTPDDALVVREAVGPSGGGYASRIWRSDARGQGEWTLAYDSAGQATDGRRGERRLVSAKGAPSRSSTAPCGSAR